MSMYSKYNIPINILTPIHIGSIDTFNANEYLFLNDEVYRINIRNFYDSLNTRNKEKFIKLIQDENFALSDLEYIDTELLKSFSRYCLINKCSPHANNNNLQVECGVKSQNKLYIPGSSIKGSIKTALFFNEIQLNQVPDINNKILFNEYKNIMHDYFKSSLEDSSIFDSILRFLQIEDSSTFDDVPHLHEVKSWYYDKKKKRMTPKHNETRYLETIPESTLQTTITVNYDKNFFQELNFNEEKEELLNIKKISKYLFSFADDLIDFEINFFSEYDRYDLVKFYEELMEYNYCNKPLILLGGANGICGKTIFLKIYKYDKRNNTHYSDNYVHLLFGKEGDSLFPKSRKLTYINSEPLGWAQLDFSSYF